ncbi:NifB/NifX family molybdenum-iron cluster-binding protein [Treponema sp. R6D11]
MKIALASSDGKFVSKHFGNTPSFVIAEADDKKWTYIEKRDNSPACGKDGHSQERFNESAKLIGDCGVVICSRIGNFAQNGLKALNIQPIEKPGFIEDILNEYVRNFASNAPKKAKNSHPCFDRAAHGKYGRIHLPVSAKCNIKCRFCERNINSDEMCPGAAAQIITPEQAVETLADALKLCPELTVAGIAGPGDALADNSAIETFRLVNKHFPQLSKCLSTNGLGLPEKVQELSKLGLKHLTVTVNAVDPKIGEKIISHIIFNGEKIGGQKAAATLLFRQLEGIREAFSLGMEIKVNTVLIPGINSEHIGEIAKTISALGVKYHNIMPLIPRGEFADVSAPDCAALENARKTAGSFLSVFRNCTHCRADACGIPGVNDVSHKLYERAGNFRCNNNCG